MHQLSVKTEKLRSGISPEEWYKAWLPKATFQGETKVEIVDAKGEKNEIVVGEAGLVLTKLRVFHETDPPCIIGTPQPKLVHFCEAIPVTDGIGQYEGIHKDELVIPLGEIKSDSDYVIISDLAVRLMTKNQRGFESHPHHICNLYMSSMQSIVWQLGNEEKKENVIPYLRNLALLMRAARSWFRYNPKSFEEVIAPLVRMAMAIDSTQRALAFLFVNQPITFEQQIRLLEIMLKRHKKNLEREDVEAKISAQTIVDFRTKFIYGIIIPLLLLPEFMEFVKSNDSHFDLENLIQRISIRFENIMKQILNDLITLQKEEDSDLCNQQILIRICQLCPLLKVLTRLDVIRLYHFCMDQANYAIAAPLSRWRLIKSKFNTPFPILVGKDFSGYLDEDGYYVKISSSSLGWSTRPIGTLPPTFQFDGKVTVLSGNSIRIHPKNDQTYCCISFVDPGKYIIKRMINQRIQPGKLSFQQLHTNKQKSVAIHFGVNTLSNQFVSKEGAWAHPQRSSSSSSSSSFSRKKDRQPIPHKFTLDLQQIVLQVTDHELKVINSNGSIWFKMEKKSGEMATITFRGTNFIVKNPNLPTEKLKEIPISNPSESLTATGHIKKLGKIPTS